MILPVILAGGIGERLWPLSRSNNPKQFLNLNNENSSLFQDTVSRVNHLKNTLPPIVIGNKEHQFIIAEQLRQINMLDNTKILLEPCAKNTLVAIGIAVNFAKKHYPSDTKLFILPADHIIDNQKLLQKSIDKSLEYINDHNLVTFGIKPHYPETEYGYIQTNNHKIIKFTEKPNLEVAKEFIKEKNYWWNSGMFIFSIIAIEQEINANFPTLNQSLIIAINNSKQDQIFIKLQLQDYKLLPNISIDYGIMEKSKHAYCVPLACNWTDIGNWNALYQHQKSSLKITTENNIITGNVLTEKCSNSLLYSKDLLLGVIGIDNLAVIANQDSILVTTKNKAKDVKLLLEKLKKSKNKDLMNNKYVLRPWGSYETIAKGSDFLVKRIIVGPQKSLSLQKHKFRSEHWVVVSGIAHIVNGVENLILEKNQSTYIPIGTKHRLTNNSFDQNLEIIEVQCGSYIGEDDIIRFEDNYGRV